VLFVFEERYTPPFKVGSREFEAKALAMVQHVDGPYLNTGSCHGTLNPHLMASQLIELET
jgi:hypothetical protein